MTTAKEVLEQILRETTYAGTPTTEQLSEQAGMPVDELIEITWDYVESYLELLADRDRPITHITLGNLFMTGFIQGRMYEERREK